MRKENVNSNKGSPNTALVVFILIIGILIACMVNVKLTDKFGFMDDYQSTFYEHISAEELKKYTYEDMQESREAIATLETQLNDMIVSGTAREDEIAHMTVYLDDLKNGRTKITVSHDVNSLIKSSINKWCAHFQKETKYPLEPEMILAIIHKESNFDPLVTSKSGAQGLMQIMPATGKYFKLNNPWDIDENIRTGVHYFKDRLNEFNGDVKLALASYNAGQGRVRDDARRSGQTKMPFNYGKLEPFLPAETRAYVPWVMKWYYTYKGQGGI
jgi:membrane-bound lytic murein transglycosylase MltF